MPVLLACRVCLATGVKLYDMYKHKLKDDFELFSGIEISQSEAFPKFLCSYCRVLLLKCSAFREKCNRTQDYLKYAELTCPIELSTYQISSLALSNNTALPYKVSTPEVTALCELHITSDLVESKEQGEQSDEEPLADKVKKIKEKSLQEPEIAEPEIAEPEIAEPEIAEPELVEPEIEIPNFEADVDYNEFETVDVEANESANNGENEYMSGGEIQVKYLSKEEQLQEVEARKESYNYTHSFYKCDYCYKGFLQDGTYKKHMLRHDPSYGKEVCEICKIRWPDVRSLRSHCTTSHERNYICKLCDYVSKSTHKAKEHLQWHKGYKFVCKLCGASFAKSTSHLTHLRLHHPTKFSCEVCGESFLGEIGLKMHMKKSHRGVEKTNTEKEFKCDPCGILFKSEEAFNKHTSGFEDGICNNSLSSCFQCGENVPSQVCLKDHMKIHDVGVRCGECNRNFAHERSYSIHYQRVHLGIKLRNCTGKEKFIRPNLWVCEICGRKCVTNASLVLHQRVHTGEKPHQCQECQKNFSTIQRLQIHYRTHTGERPYKCLLCPKAFKHKAALNRHNLVHSGIRPYQCIYCNRNFSQSNSMKVHVQTVHFKLPAPYRARRDRFPQYTLNDNDIDFLDNETETLGI